MQPIQPTETMKRPYGDRRDGWVVFSGLILFLVGMLHVAQGLLLVSEDRIYVGESEAATVVIGNASTWGWVIALVGGLEMLAGAGIYSRNQLARWFGVASASVGLLVQFGVFFGGNSEFSFLLTLLCVLVIYGLIVHGGRQDEVS